MAPATSVVRRPRLAAMEIRHLGPGDTDAVLAAWKLFDRTPNTGWTDRFLAERNHHLLIAYVEDEPAGFVSGIETTHPDKGTEMLLYELGVDDAHRLQGIGTALTTALRDLARHRGNRGMWVIIDHGDEIPAATYRAAGATERESAEILSWDF